MNLVKVAFALAFVVAGTTIESPTATAQTPAPQQLHNSRIRIEYQEPRYLKTYQRLKARQVLEELDELMSPLRLDHDLKLTIEDNTSDCRGDDPNSFYDPNDYTVHICYNFFDMLNNGASVQNYKNASDFRLTTTGLMPGVKPAEVIVGGTIGVALHEIGHAIFHNLNVPRLGREEDAADQIAAFIMLQFGPSVAIPVIKGTFNVWHHLQAVSLNASGGGISSSSQADVHSLSLQRAMNFLCLAYGSPDSASFKGLADQWLTDERKANCQSEYKTALVAFTKTILPRVDQDRMKKVLAMQIFRPEDFQ